MLFEVKISDQYVNILSILRGKAVNIQYQYLEGRESIFIQILKDNRDYDLWITSVFYAAVNYTVGEGACRLFLFLRG